MPINKLKWRRDCILRDKIAYCLKMKRKNIGIDRIASDMDISEGFVYNILKCSDVYVQRKTYSSSDHGFAGKWAKKIIIVNYLGGSCVECGLDNIFCLDFHHLHNKKVGVSVLIQRNFKIEKILQEAKKCQLLCRNCHYDLHHFGNKNIKNKIYLMEAIGQHHCFICGYCKNTACLEFHHKKGSGL